MLRLSTLLVLVSCIVLHAQKPYSSVIDNADGTQTFNLCVSLHRTANAVERAQYEDVIHHMARAIYEASNGGHYVGEIRFFQNGRHQGAADIIWTEAEWPRATPNGLNPRMGKIRIGDWTRDWGSPVDWLQTAENRERLGYTLGHEFGHYVYSMYDQYKLNNPAADPASPIPSDPLFADTPTEPSIMNDQYEAVGGNWEWLNFDTPNNFELNNAHGRVWGVSGWEFLTQAVTDDPLNGTVTAQPPRTRYNALAGRAPTAASTWTNPNSSTDFTWMQVDLDAPGADPLRDLDIIWMNDEIELVFYAGPLRQHEFKQRLE